MNARMMMTAVLSILISTLLVLVITSSISLNYIAKAQQTSVTRILVGGGNNTYPFYGYDPQRADIKAGSTVVWSVPSLAPLEPHTVSFIFNNKTFALPTAPFVISNSSKFVPLPNDANSKPNVVPGINGTSIALVSNAMSYDPSSIDQTGNAKTYVPNSNLHVSGNEQYINSGWLVPKGTEKIFPGASTIFTLTFPKSGTYRYTCTLHPWMIGQVVVKQ
jgi:plastocyanin